MTESISNVEFAQKIHEQGHRDRLPFGRQAVWVEIVEAALLAIVAIATAWSGYQAAKWDARSAAQYTRAADTTVLSDEKKTLAGQDKLYDIVTFNGWVAARTADNVKLAEFYERRFRPEYRAAFAAWQKLDPFHNPSAPAGPIFMPEYTDANAQESAKLSKEANGYFEQGVSTRETGDKYVKVTVLLATVLLLIAIGQRFEIFGPRVAVLTVAFTLLAFSAFRIVTLPRI